VMANGSSSFRHASARPRTSRRFTWSRTGIKS
jgi:hypothetical protein